MGRIYRSSNAAIRGPLDLKRAYQRNLIKAEIILLVVIGAVLAAAAMLMAEQKPKEWVEKIIVTDTLNFVPPPIVTRIVPPIDLPDPPKPPDVGAVEPVDDSLAAPDIVLPSTDEIRHFYDVQGAPGADSTVFVASGSATQEIFPEPDSFVAVDEHPKVVRFPSVHYPEMARKAGIEGKVWLKVLVDVNGDVRDVIILTDSGANAGFEEAALSAARDSKWRPAMQNRQPIPVWVAYEVKFRLK